MQNLFTKIRWVSWEKLFFRCCLVCISMTREFRCQYALENKAGIPASDTWSWHTVPPVYRSATPQGSLRKAGIPASDILRVNQRCRFASQSFHMSMLCFNCVRFRSTWVDIPVRSTISVWIVSAGPRHLSGALNKKTKTVGETDFQ